MEDPKNIYPIQLECLDMWIRYSNEMQKKLSQAIDPKNDELREMYNQWMSCTNDLSRRLSTAQETPFDTKRYNELYKVWLDYGDELKNIITRLMEGTDQTKNEMYRIWKDTNFNFYKKVQGSSPDNADPNDPWKPIMDNIFQSPLTSFWNGKDISNFDWFEKFGKFHQIWMEANTKLVNWFLSSPPFGYMLKSNIDRSSDLYRAMDPYNFWQSPVWLKSDHDLHGISKRIKEVSEKVEDISAKRSSRSVKRTKRSH